MWKPGGHLGPAVSALVDGQLDPATAEHAWEHVLSCRSCRALVEQEGRVKTELATLSGSEPPEGLLGSLYSLERSDTSASASASTSAWDAWRTVDDIESRGRRRRRAGLAVLGAGSLSVAALGLVSLSATNLGMSATPPSGAPTAFLTGPSPGTSPAPGRDAADAPVIALTVEVRGWFPAGSEFSSVRQQRR